MNEILNPYIAGAPVVETSMFFGREDVFSWIERSLAGKYVDHILVLHGQRRVGKTSVLKQIPNFLPDTYIQVFFDLQGRTNTTLERFLWWLAREIARTLKQARDISLPRPEREAFAADPEYLINEFLPDLKPLLGDRVLLLTFDEFDTLDRPEIRETLAAPLIAYLRRLMDIDWLNFVFSIGSSGDKLENMQASYTDFFKSALYRKISFLTRDDCHRLITKPVEGIIAYDRKAVNRIVEITSGHPYFTQLVCHELFSLCQKTKSRRIEVEDVESVLEDVIERGTVNLKFVWDEANDLEKWILAGLAHLDSDGTTQALAKLLQEQRVRFSESDLNSGIIHLRDKDVITQANQFVIHLMRMWLQANRPMDRVREELVEVNPIANRYIEIGDEYCDLEQVEQAIESYQQALSVDPGNLKAQANIASVYLEQGAHQKAAQAFEAALKIDDEDVISRTGFCDANLALGDQARTDDEVDDAVRYYQKILVINAAHTDARQRLADIHQEWAEAYLEEGQDEEALSAFNRAMEYTPEDDRLAARYNQVLAEKKAKAIAAWLLKTDQAVAQQHWDEAAEMVSEALKLDPDSHDLQNKLLEVKDAPRQHKIQTYTNEAEQAITRGNFDRAISALETAVLLSPEDPSLAEWLESTRGDQLNAQLRLYRDRAARAIASGDWEAAVAAREAAVQHDPNDPALVQELAETKTAWLQARLDAAQIRAEEAFHKQDWDTAIRAVQAAMVLAPEETYWEEKLTEIQAAQLKAQLQAYRSEAASARSTGNWDAAMLALEKTLELEPGDAWVQAEIEQIRDEAHQEKLAALRSQAENAARDENWGAATQFWGSYLELEPEDGDKAEANLQHAQKYAVIARDYDEARSTFQKKRYGRAIELLQGIIAQDPTYKSTSQLLVEAVEANKAIPVWRRPWLLPAAGMILIILLGVFFGPKLWESIPRASEQTPVATESSATKTVSQTQLAENTAKALAFAEPILNYIANTPPAFAEDFSSRQNYWDEIPVGPDLLISDRVADGMLRFNEEPIVNTYYGFADNPTFESSNFILQFDFIPHDISWGTKLYIEFRYGDGGSYLFQVLDSGEWQVGLMESVTNPTLASGTTKLEMDQVTAVQIIAFGDQFAIYWNDELLAYFKDSTFQGGGKSFGFEVTLKFQLDIDNIKYWTLDDVDLSAGSLEPAEVPLGTIQEYLDSHMPTFEEDFSTPQDYWSDQLNNEFKISDFVSSGALRIVDETTKSSSYSLRIGPYDEFGDFFLQFDFKPQKFKIGSTLGISFREQNEGGYTFGLDSDGTWEFRGNSPSQEQDTILANGSTNPLVMDQSYQIQGIAIGSQIAVLLNGEPLVTIDDDTVSHGLILIQCHSILSMQVEIDNVKLWTLDDVDLSAGLPGPAEIPFGTIQEYLDSHPPTFEDDFSVLNEDWGGLGEPYDIHDFEVNGVLNLDLERDTSELVSLNLRGHMGDLLAAADFALQFDYSAEEIGENTSIYVDFHWGARYSYVGYNLHIEPAQGTWEMVKFGFPPEVLGSGQIPGSGAIEQWNNVELVAVGDLFAVTLNGERVGTFRDDEWTGNLNRIRVETADPVVKIKLDNLKLWNLEGVEFSTAAELNQPGGQSTMVQIPAGEFIMGSSATDSEARENELPEHAVNLDDYWIDKTEVTNAMFADFLNDQGNQSEGGELWYSAGEKKSHIIQDGDQWTVAPGWEDHPVTLVTWYGAEAFCEWTGLRLPTEAEWEKAARGTDTTKFRRYPWGDEYNPERANLLGSSADGYETTAPVGSFPEGESPYGVLDMAGNVFEWVADWYEADYYERSETNNPAGPTSGSGKVTRGGSYKENSIFGRSAARFGNDPIYSEVSETTGVRCASSTPPDQAQSLSEIIKDYINSQTPTFEDDFSSIKSSWGYDSDGKGVLSFIGDGVLTVNMNNEDETKRFPLNNLISAYNFTLEYDFETLSDYSFPTDFGVRFRFNKEQSSYYEFYSADQRNSASLTRIDESGTRTTLANSYAGIGSGSCYHVLIVVVGKQIEIYLNNDLLIAVEDDTLSGEKNLFWFGSNGSVIIDNVKFWNLDGVDL